MEQRLAKFRAMKASKESAIIKNDNNKSSPVSINQEEKTPSKVEENDSESNFLVKGFRKIHSINFVLKVVLWICLQMFFVQIQFGAVYFVVSLLTLMCLSMKNNQRKPDEPSAYSVFNKDCERIDGTFTAEQFEKQMIYGGAVR